MIFKKYILHLLICIATVFLLKDAVDLIKVPVDEYRFTLDIQLTSPDTLQFYYISEANSSFSGDESQLLPVAASQEFQKITFTLPTSLGLKKIRFDLGDHAADTSGNETMVIRSIFIGNEISGVTYSGDSLLDTFHPTGWISRFDKDGTIVTRTAAGVYDPELFTDDISPVLTMVREQQRTIPYSNFLWIFFSITAVIIVFIVMPPVASWQLSGKPALIFLFLAILVTPTFVTFLGSSGDKANLEKRALVKAPEFEMTKRFARDFESFFSDNFGLRYELVDIGSRIKTGVFNASLNPEKVVIGKDDWIFYNNSDGDDYIYRSYTHLNLFRPEELKQEGETLIARNKDLASKGIVYIKGFCPQTQTIYPEMMPWLMKLQIRDTVSKVDQVMNYLKASGSDFNLVDIRPDLIKGKSETQIYRKLDSHWNSYGAYIGYASFFNQTFPRLGVKPRPMDDFKIEWVDNGGGDLVNLLGISNNSRFIDKTAKFTLVKDPVSFTELSADGYPPQTVITHCDSCPDSRKVVVFRDSYSGELVQFISLHFKDVVYLWWGYNQQMVDNIHPDVVIEIPVERYF